MPTIKKKDYLNNTEESVAIEQTLRDMVESATYHTESSYSADGDKYPEGIIPFIDKHMKYLRSHPTTDPQQYLSNLRLMTRVR